MYPRSFGDVFPTEADEPDCFHARVGESSIAGKLRQALHSILEGIDGCREMVLENSCWENKDRFFITPEFRNGDETHAHIHTLSRDNSFCENVKSTSVPMEDSIYY